MAIVTQETGTDLQVLEHYKELMKTSTEDDSIYLKAKDTITSYVDSENFTLKEKADIVSKTIVDMTTQMTAQAMSTALQIATENRDAPYALTKVRVDTELTDAQRKNAEQEHELLVQREDEVQAKIDTTIIGGWNIQANMYRDTGFNTSNLSTGNAILVHTGTKEEIGIKTQQYKTSQADTYSKWAGAIQANGFVPYSLNSSGMPTGNLSSEGMVAEQTRVAERQRYAFDDNMRQHVLNSSASMLGVMIGSEAFETAAAYTPHLDKWDEAAEFLNTTRALADGARPAGTIDMTLAVPSVLVIGSSITLSGIASSVSDGTSVVIKFIGTNTVYGGVCQVGVGSSSGEWSVTILATKTIDITHSGTVIIEASLIDQRERRVYDQAIHTIA